MRIATLYMRVLSGCIETLLIGVLLENANIIGNENWFGPMAPIAYNNHITHNLSFVSVNGFKKY